MGNKFLALRKSEVAKVAPDRAALMGKVSQEMADMKTIREADRRWLSLLFGEPYEAKFQSEGTGSAIHVKKKLIIVFVVIAVVLLLIPVRKVYEDGGTQTYTSLTYKVIVWKQIDGKSGTEFYLFSNNFHQLDYYENQ